MKFNYYTLYAEAKRRGYKQKDLADLLGMSEKNLSERKCKGKELTATQVAMICAEIGTTFEMFVTKED